jgi:sugar phosphate isomerase/epimerase
VRLINRRDFLASSAVLVAGACAGRLPVGATAGRPTTTRLPLGFSTLGCPQWSWLQVLDFADAHGYAAIELRGLQETMDLTTRVEFGPVRLPETRAQLAARGLRVICLGSSANMHEMDGARAIPQLDEVCRFVDLAEALRAPFVRVFGNRYVDGVPRETTLDHIAARLRDLGTYAAPRGVTILIESHGDFTDSTSLLAILTRAASPAVALLWDAHHTFASSNETPDQTVLALGRWIRHTHLKDSIPADNERRYVLTGAGDVPVRQQVEVLAASGYAGYYSFEWEKRWHPEIEEPEVALAHFANVAGEYLRSAGVREVSSSEHT